MANLEASRPQKGKLMSGTSVFRLFITWLSRRAGLAGRPVAKLGGKVTADTMVTPPPGPMQQPDQRVAWGRRVSPEFKRKVIAIAGRLQADPNHLMAIMAFETGRSFDPAVTNHAGSGATGLIQFMPRTAEELDTTTHRLARMSAVDQLDYVEKPISPLSRAECTTFQAPIWRCSIRAPSPRRRASTCCFAKARVPTSSTADST
jgi:hypothetical protein